MKIGVESFTVRPSDLVAKYLLPVPAILFSVVLHALVLERRILPPEDKTMIPLN